MPRSRTRNNRSRSVRRTRNTRRMRGGNLRESTLLEASTPYATFNLGQTGQAQGILAQGKGGVPDSSPGPWEGDKTYSVGQLRRLGSGFYGKVPTTTSGGRRRRGLNKKSAKKVKRCLKKASGKKSGKARRAATKKCMQLKKRLQKKH